MVCAEGNIFGTDRDGGGSDDDNDNDDDNDDDYNGWTHDHYVTNLFLFAPHGTITFLVLIVQMQFTIHR